MEIFNRLPTDLQRVVCEFYEDEKCCEDCGKPFVSDHFVYYTVLIPKSNCRCIAHRKFPKRGAGPALPYELRTYVGLVYHADSLPLYMGQHCENWNWYNHPYDDPPWTNYPPTPTQLTVWWDWDDDAEYADYEVEDEDAWSFEIWYAYASERARLNEIYYHERSPIESNCDDLCYLCSSLRIRDAKTIFNSERWQKWNYLNEKESCFHPHFTFGGKIWALTNHGYTVYNASMYIKLHHIPTIHHLG